MAYGLGSLYPAGVVRDDRNRISISADFYPGQCKIILHIIDGDDGPSKVVCEWKEKLEQLSKKKFWGKEPQWGLKVTVDVNTK